MTKRKYREEGKGVVEENKVAWFINNSIWSRAFVERHLRRRSRFFRVSSISSPLYSLHFRAETRSVYAFVFLLWLCLWNCYIHTFVCAITGACSVAHEEICRGKRSFHNHYRALKGPTLATTPPPPPPFASKFPFTTKISRAFLI